MPRTMLNAFTVYRRRLPAGLALLLGGCVTYPVALPLPPDGCGLVTRELTLETKVLTDGNSTCPLRLEACLVEILVGTAAFTATTLVSGSIVLVGNTVHWMERSRRCAPATAAFAPAKGL